MHRFYIAISWIFHPVWIPILGTLLFLFTAPFTQYTPWAQKNAVLIPIIIITILIPTVLFWSFKTINWVGDAFAKDKKSRKLILLLAIPVYALVVSKVYQEHSLIVLYFFYLALIMAYASALILLLANYKASLHMLAMGALWAFMIGLSIHFEKNISIALSVWILCVGFVGSARVFVRAHNFWELLIGFLIGGISQLMLFQYWI